MFPDGDPASSNASAPGPPSPTSGKQTQSTNQSLLYEYSVSTERVEGFAGAGLK